MRKRIRPMIQLSLILFLALFLINSDISAQPHKAYSESILIFNPDLEMRKLPYAELFRELNRAIADSSEYHLDNTEIWFDVMGADSIFRSKAGQRRKDEVNIILPSLENLSFSESVTFTRCKFQHIPLLFNNCTFNVLEFYECEFSLDVKFDSCQFNHQLNFRNCESPKGIRIWDSEINYKPLPNPGNPNKHWADLGLKFSSCKLDFLDLERMKINMNPVDFENIELGSYAFIDIFQTEINKMNLINIEFPDSDSLPIQDARFFYSQVHRLALVNTEFEILNLDHLTVSKALWVDNIVINKIISIEAFDYSFDNTNMSWKYLKDRKIGIAMMNFPSDSVYMASTDDEIRNEHYYNELISVYNKLYHMYKVRGDIKSANGCYIEMKDIETRMLYQVYINDNEGSMKNYFNWKLNQFLKYFCEYGTSPVRSLIISMYVMLGFAVFYFFFYSDWDRINRTFLMRKYNKLLTYFRSEQKLEDFYTEEHKEEFRSYAQFKDNLQESKIEVPLFINLLGKPLYHLSLVQHNVKQWLYRRSEILSGKWIDLSKGRRIYVSVLTGVSVLFYIGYLISIRSINSLFLSINTFSTLGFGDIPVRGISRYMAILEGFLGWFLLSIFSVSLISQILQN